MSEFRLPDVGEGLTEAEIITWRVGVGDEVKVNDVLVDIETAKSIVELPSPFAGRVAALLVAEGETVAVGVPIVRIQAADSELAEDPESDAKPKVLVGYGPSERIRRTRTARVQTEVKTTRVLAKPPVRKLAKDLGIDLADVAADGRVVTRADVLRANEPAAGSELAAAAVISPLSSVRRVTAEAMTASALVPQVTEWVSVDVTASYELAERLDCDRRFAGVKVGMTLLAAKAICLALGVHPQLHGRWLGDAIETPETVGLGIATATDRGLMVPVVAAADRLSLVELGVAIADLVATARAGKLQPSQMAGGTFTLTNVGVFGVDGGTPILPPGQTGIMSLGQVSRQPWVVEEVVVPRWVTTLAVTFDHRVVDGEQASKFLRDVADILHDPALAVAF